MELKDYIKLLADKENNKPIEQPAKLPDDLDKLVNGLKNAQSKAYDCISTCDNMEQIANAVNIVQFATAHITTVYNSYYDLINRIKAHNEKLEEKKN